MFTASGRDRLLGALVDRARAKPTVMAAALIEEVEAVDPALAIRLRCPLTTLTESAR